MFGMVVGFLIAMVAVSGLMAVGMLVLGIGLGAAMVGMSLDAPEAVAQVRTASVGTRDGEIAIHTVAMVQIYVDGEAAAYDTASGSYIVRVQPGRHIVQVRNAWMKEVARQDVDLRSGRRLLLDYDNRNKAFSRVGETQLRREAAPAEPAVVYVAPQPVVYAAPQPVVVVEAPQPRGGFLSGFKSESTSRQKSSSSSTRYGETTTSGMGRTHTDGYHDTVSAESEQTERRSWGF
ncbi:MAG: hypothetical protein R3F61_36930 [Myxococcota bacterium]